MKTHVLVRWAGAFALCASSVAALAHGNEPHGEEDHPGVAPSAVTGAPRFEAATDVFEAVGRLDARGLVLLINRYESSEPVLHAEVELELGDRKARAAFQPAPGSYVVTDEDFLGALERPGSHVVVMTVTAGDEADLMDARLDVAEREVRPGNENEAPVVPALAGVLGGAAVGAGAMALRRGRSLKGGER